MGWGRWGAMAEEMTIPQIRERATTKLLGKGAAPMMAGEGGSGRAGGGGIITLLVVLLKDKKK
jgi:hypothetical protein